MSWGSMTGERRAGLQLLSYVRKSWRAREQGLDEGTARAECAQMARKHVGLQRVHWAERVGGPWVSTARPGALTLSEGEHGEGHAPPPGAVKRTNMGRVETEG